MADDTSTPAPRHTQPRERRTWLVGIDGSESARHAALWATAHASGRAEEIRLTHSWNMPVVASVEPLGPVMLATDMETVERAAQSTVDDLAAQLRPQVDVAISTCVAQGSPAPLLLEAAHSGSLIVVGSRGRGGFARLVLGSTSTQCATHATAPVAVIPLKAPIHPAKRIVVGFDGSDNAVAALTWAVDFATATEATAIDCVLVWDSTPVSAGADQFFFPEASELAREHLESKLWNALGGRAPKHLSIRIHFVEGRPRDCLAEFAADADLLVMGARGHGAIGAALLGSVSTWLLHHLEVPMVVVPHEAD